MRDTIRHIIYDAFDRAVDVRQGRADTVVDDMARQVERGSNRSRQGKLKYFWDLGMLMALILRTDKMQWPQST